MVKELITEISGVDTDPFNRYVGDISVERLVKDVEQHSKQAKNNGYGNLTVRIETDSGITDVYLYGEREYNTTELKMIERFDVINRIKDKTSDGLTRDDLLK